jgi:hypothetical protein
MKFDRKKLSRQVFPGATCFDVSHAAPRDSVVNSDNGVFSRIGNDRYRVRLGQFSIRRCAVSVSGFINRVLGVICFSATLQVVRVTARGVVAFVMAHNLVGNIFSSYRGEHRSVSQKKLPAVKNTTIAICVGSAGPQPAVFSFVDIFQQAAQQGTVFFGLLVARIRAVFQFMFFGDKRFSASSTNSRSVNFPSFKFTGVRTVDAFRGAERKELIATLFTGVRFGDANINVFHKSIIA